MNPGNQILKLFGRVLDQSIDQLDCMPCRLRASSETKHQNMLIQKYVLKKNVAKKVLKICHLLFCQITAHQL